MTTFLDNFERQCKARAESPCHALEAAGLSKSLWSKWKKQPDRAPNVKTIQTLADYFGCDFQDLEGRYTTPRTDTFTNIVNSAACLNEHDQEKLLSYILFTYREELPSVLQKLRP